MTKDKTHKSPRTVKPVRKYVKKDGKLPLEKRVENSINLCCSNSSDIDILRERVKLAEMRSSTANNLFLILDKELKNIWYSLTTISVIVMVISFIIAKHWS